MKLPDIVIGLHGKFSDCKKITLGKLLDFNDIIGEFRRETSRRLKTRK